MIPVIAHTEAQVQKAIMAYLAGRPTSTQRVYRAAIRLLHGSLRALGISQDGNWKDCLRVGPIESRIFTAALIQRYQKSATAYLYSQAISGLYDIFVELQLISSNPWVDTKVPHRYRAPKRIPQRISADVVSRMLRSCDLRTIQGQQDYAVLCVLFGGGLRRQEATNLKCGDISPRGLRLLCTKGEERHDQSLPDWAQSGVEKWLVLRKSCGAKDNDPFLDISYQTIWRRFKAIARAAGCDASTHSARVTAINELIDMGYSDREVMRFSRHKHVAEVETYVRRNKDPKQNPGLNLKY